LLPHPVNFLWYEQTSSLGTTIGNFMNTQLTGTTHVQKMVTLIDQARRWRLAYMGVTIHQDGPDLANQGTICSSQAPVQPSMFSSSNISGFQMIARSNIAAYQSADMPNFSNMQTMPSAYFNRSKEGAYIPLKLTKTCQQWHSPSDLEFCWDRVTSTGGGQVGFGAIDLPLGSTPGIFPHTNLESAGVDPGTGQRFGNTTSAMCNDVFANVATQNVAVATSFTFFVRAGFEIEVQPGSIFSTHLKLSPPHDAQALATYFAISRELKDAYPADYNDLGEIWKVISGIAKTVAPVLSGIPGIGSLLGGAVSGVASVGDSIQALVSRATHALEPKAEGEPAASQADVDLARMMRRQVLPARVPRGPPRKPRKGPKKAASSSGSPKKK
jgi:hypothetical protein